MPPAALPFVFGERVRYFPVLEYVACKLRRHLTLRQILGPENRQKATKHSAVRLFHNSLSPQLFPFFSSGLDLACSPNFCRGRRSCSGSGPSRWRAKRPRVRALAL